MKIKLADALLIILMISSLATSYLYYNLFIYTRSLEREKEAHQWRNFTCDVLLSEPKTRAIMCAKKFKQLK